MKRITGTLCLFLAISAFVVGCGSSNVSNPEITEPNTQASDSVKLTESEVKDTLTGLIPKAVEIYGIFNGNGAFKSDPKKTIPGEEDYCLVIGQNGTSPVDIDNVKSIADLKKVVEDVFTKDMAGQKNF
ncbi:hypothetical protein [Brevibacillus reuszeri]|uniref:hypothetical protein n=1 Tax=Brevibacillus reuszeri TaxID=54915 RepID=UPI003D234BB7